VAHVSCPAIRCSVETASVFAKVFRRPIKTVHGTEEWAATEKDVSQAVYRETERKCWEDFDYENDDGESLNRATQRIIHHLTEIARRHPGRPVMVSGHAILFALFFGHLRGERATEESKDRIKFASWSVVERRSNSSRVAMPCRAIKSFSRLRSRCNLLDSNALRTRSPI